MDVRTPAKLCLFVVKLAVVVYYRLLGHSTSPVGKEDFTTTCRTQLRSLDTTTV